MKKLIKLFEDKIKWYENKINTDSSIPEGTLDQMIGKCQGLTEAIWIIEDLEEAKKKNGKRATRRKD